MKLEKIKFKGQKILDIVFVLTKDIFAEYKKFSFSFLVEDQAQNKTLFLDF